MAWHDYQCPSCGPVTNDRRECPNCGLGFTPANILWLSSAAIGKKAPDDRLKQQLNTSSLVKRTDAVLGQVLGEFGRTDVPKRVEQDLRPTWGNQASQMIDPAIKPTGDALKDLATLQQRGILGATSGQQADPTGKNRPVEAGAASLLENRVFAPVRPSQMIAATKDDMRARDKP